MKNKIKKKLNEFSLECKNHLNNLKIITTAGKYNIELSSRTLSDVIEKEVISFIIDYFGKNNIKYGSWTGYDVIIVNLENITIYVNIKTNLFNPKMDGTWLCSASVIEKLKKQRVLEFLYCVKFEYKKEDNYLKFISEKVAGPISDIELIYYAKGEETKYKIRREFNGRHCHILNKYYE
ncbi:MAG: hypothetical protein B6U87_00975 [Candidatus Aenigmarchaeota archaeon ex4484_52]|nr:MAG: hypothetical protein B6U87_00975 [Candidatus Aenigmarchaeota archaeon ex4484_52]